MAEKVSPKTDALRAMREQKEADRQISNAAVLAAAKKAKRKPKPAP